MTIFAECDDLLPQWGSKLDRQHIICSVRA